MSQESKKQSNVMTYVLVAAVVALIGVNIAYVLSGGSGQAGVDEEAPDFTLPVINPTGDMGDEISLSALKGKVVVIDFWTTT